jgi:hypothetical protein
MHASSRVRIEARPAGALSHHADDQSRGAKGGVRAFARAPRRDSESYMTGGRLTASDVERELHRQLAYAQQSGLPFVDIRAGDLHQDVKGDARVPLVCHVMQKLMGPGDEVLPDGPPSGQGPSLVVRYRLPCP